MSGISKIGTLNPAAVLRDVSERLTKLKSLVVVGIYDDSSADIWASDPLDHIERSAVLLMKWASDAQMDKSGNGDVK